MFKSVRHVAAKQRKQFSHDVIHVSACTLIDRGQQSITARIAFNHSTDKVKYQVKGSALPWSFPGDRRQKSGQVKEFQITVVLNFDV